MKKKKYSILLLIFFLSIIVNGCWDSREIDNLGIVDFIGIDKQGEFYDVTVEIMNPSGVASSSGGGEEKKAIIQNVTGLTAFDAVRKLNLFVSRKPYMSHNKIYLIGEYLAREGVMPIIDFATRDPELRKTMNIIVTSNKITEIFNTHSRIENTIGMEITNIIDNYTTNSYIPKVTLNDFTTDLCSKTSDPYTPVIFFMESNAAEKPLAAEKEGIIAISGLAVFKGDKLKGYLNQKETRGVLWIIGEVNGGILSLSSKNKETSMDTSIELRRENVSIETIISKNNYIVNLVINAYGNIGSYYGKKDILDYSVIKEIERITAEEIKKEVTLAFKKVQQYYGADIFDIGKKFIIQNPDKEKYLVNNWDVIFKQITLKVKVDFKIDDVGFLGSCLK